MEGSLSHRMPGGALYRSLAEDVSAPSPQPEASDIVEVYSFNTGIMVLLMILWSSFGHQVARRTKFMGEGSVACALGLITGLGILITQRYFTEEVLHQLLTFNPADFFTYLLPPIIFYAGLSVKKKQFFRNFVSIAAFGIVGTYIAFAVIACVLYGFSKLPNILTLPDCLALGVIFAATDSVAVLQVLKQDKMPLLYSLVFGEGVINDATSVALLRAVQALDGTEVLSAGTVATILIKFLYLFAASMILGLAFGLGTSWLMKAFHSNSTPQEVALVGMLGYMSYLTGELLGLSGIVTLFCCAVAISHYALHNVSSMSRVTIVSAFQTLSYVSEGAIFIYVGMDMLDPIKWKNTEPIELTWLFCVLLLLMVLGRAAFVFPLSFLHNWWSKEQLSVKEMVIIWWSGLIRGAVSVALVYYYFDPDGKSSDSHQSTLIATTLIEVMVSIFIFGAATKPLLDYLIGPQVLEKHGSMAMELMSGGSRWSRSGPSDDGKGGQLYTVVSMDPDDEVVNHMDLPDDVREKRLGDPSYDSLAGISEDGFKPGPRQDRLLGSHGQNLSELAENMPPAMAIQDEVDEEPHTQLGFKWGFVDQAGAAGDAGDAIGIGHGNGGSFHQKPPANASEHTGQAVANGIHSGGGANGLHAGHANGPPPASASLSRGERPGGAARPERGARPWSGPDGRPVPSAFESSASETVHARAVADVTEAQRQEDERNNLLQRSDSLPAGRLHTWWSTFDARYMQPVFGGAPQHTTAAVELLHRNSRTDQSDT